MGLFLIGGEADWSGLGNSLLKAKIVIAGGGVLGLSVAIHCARKADAINEPVVLLDRGDLGAGSSIRSGAVLRQYDSERTKASMGRDSLRYYQALVRSTGRSVGYKRTGVLTLAGPDQVEAIRSIDETIEMNTSIGIKMKRVGAEQVRYLIPGIEVDEGVVGAYEPDGGTVDPLLTLQCFATLARSYGATVRMGGSEVTDLILEGGRIAGVRTPRGEIQTDTVVMTAGPWTNRFLARYGINLPINIIRPSYLFVSMPGSDEGDELLEGEDLFSTAYRKKDELGLLSTGDSNRDMDEEVEMRFGAGEGNDLPAPHPVLHDLESDFYVKAEPSNSRTRISRLAVSNHVTVDNPDDYDNTVEPSFATDARAALVGRLPFYAEEEDIGTDCNLVCQTPDDRGLIGPIEALPGLFVISGFMGNDFNLAPSVGEGVAQMLWDEPVSAFDPEFFSPARFGSLMKSDV